MSTPATTARRSPALGGVATRLTRELVRAASPNPPGDERAVAEVVHRFLSGVPGAEVADVGVDPRRPMISATLRGAAPGPTLLLNGHMDTVPAGRDWTRDAFGGELDGGRIHGRGASDMKSGLAALMVAFARLGHLRAGLAGTVVLHAVPDEEPGGALGTRVLLERGELVGDFALVAEPTELRVYRAQKGNIFARLTVDGVSAHGSMPHRGVNAISRAVRLVLDLEEVLGGRLAGTAHPLVGPATLNVGTIEGGTATNVVPDRCVVSVDRRVLPGESADAALAELTELVGDRATIEVTHMGASFETPETHPLVVAAQAALTAVTGRATPCGGLVGSSDARFYADGAGIPTILLGPGSMDQAHVADEYVEAAAVETCVEVFVELALGLLGGAA